ncbi:MAG: hypothetical protein LC687_07790, partial [Actinobacteria bacterium]|nr:hypothetical protein [Actinomycetota bacterium]
VSDGLNEIRRVMRPGGSGVITDWCQDFASMRLLGLYLSLTGRTHIMMLNSIELEQELAQAGFEAEIRKYKINPMWGLMTAKF